MYGVTSFASFLKIIKSDTTKLSIYFDPNYYKQVNQDVANSGLISIKHMMLHGVSEMRKFLWEGHIGVKLQLLKKIEITYSFTRRSSAIRNGVPRNPIWGPFGLKYLIGEEGEGCYNI